MPPKRKTKDLEDNTTTEGPRRSSRRISSGVKSEVVKDAPVLIPKTSQGKPKSKQKSQVNIQEVKEDVKEDGVKEEIVEELITTEPAKETAVSAKPETKESSSDGRQYWLMKAEPESRIERGHDIKFSIDDLAAKTSPEPWDGIRAYPGSYLPFKSPKSDNRNRLARNNLRNMKKGDLAFFYHSSCKVPAIVGIMTIVEEHTPDVTAHDPSAPYYDPKSLPSDPKWSYVHVTFKQKLATPITLKQMKEWQQEKGHALENMQMLKLSRLSVSKVSEAEWKFLVEEMGRNGDVVDG